MNDPTTPPSSVPELLALFHRSEGRDKKRLLAAVLAGADRERALALAPALRDPSPRVASRIAALLARFELDDELELQLRGLKEGRARQVRAWYARMRRRRAAEETGADEA